MASDWELVKDLVEFLRSLTEEEFLAIMYGEWFVGILNVCRMLTAKCWIYTGPFDKDEDADDTADDVDGDRASDGQ